MKVNCIAGAIITPVKCKNQAQPPPQNIFPKQQQSTVDLSKRFSPTKIAEEQLNKMNRCHKYVHHNTDTFKDLRKMKLTPAKSKKLSLILQEDKLELPDFLIRLEGKSVDDGDFTNFLRIFLSKQLNIPPEESFTAYTVFSYGNSFEMAVEDSYYELLNYYSEKTICDKCESVTGGDDTIHFHNLNTLKSLQLRDCQELDDSFNDKDYLEKEPESIDSDSDSSFGGIEKESSGDPFMFNDGDDEDLCVNPFMSSDAIENPFREITRVHSTPVKATNLLKTLCDHCGKDFGKTGNLKMHLGIMLLHYILYNNCLLL